jgi:hypothetical protein
LLIIVINWFMIVLLRFICKTGEAPKRPALHSHADRQ